MAYSVNDTLKKAEKEYGLGGGFFKVQEGDNKIRILTQFRALEEEYTNKKGETSKSVKFYCHVIDRSNGSIKLGAFPYSIMKAVASLQMNDDYSFADMPMPYDITINAVGAGTMAVKYSVMPARNNVELTAEEKKALESLDIDAAIERLKEKKGISEGHDPESENEVPTIEIEPENLPF